MLSLLASFDSGKPNTVIDEVDGGKAKTPGTLARKVALINKDGLIDTRWGNMRIVNLGFDAQEPIAEAAE